MLKQIQLAKAALNIASQKAPTSNNNVIRYQNLFKQIIPKSTFRNYSTKIFAPDRTNLIKALKHNQIGIRIYKHSSSTDISVVDIDMDCEMIDPDDKDDIDEFTGTSSGLGDQPQQKFDVGTLFPMDSDSWTELQEAIHGKSEVDPFLKNPYNYLAPPKNRTGEYVFRGIKIIFPKSMLKSEFYRYRFEEKDQNLTDDIRIINFAK